MTRRTRLYFLASFKICTLLWRGGIHAKRSASLSATLDQNDGPIEIFAMYCIEATLKLKRIYIC